MKNLWNDGDAEKMVADYATKGVGRDLALRVYTTRLLGGEPRLVLHGGGNTSVQAKVTDLVGDEWDVLCVKGSGWDMGVIEPQGLPAVKLGAAAQGAQARQAVRRGHGRAAARQSHRPVLAEPVGRDAAARLPAAQIRRPHPLDRRSWRSSTRKTASRSAQRCSAAKMGFVPYIMPGFDLAKAAAEIFEQDPSVEGLILDKHGIFTFGDDAQAGL